jgi:hypothetical protein
MKCLRVPWIRCRADEVDTETFELEWRNRPVPIMAHSEGDAKAWWRSLTGEQKDELLGLESAPAGDEMTLF